MPHFGPRQRSPFKNSLTPSRRHRRQTGPVYRAIVVRSSSSGSAWVWSASIEPIRLTSERCPAWFIRHLARCQRASRTVRDVAITASPLVTPAAASRARKQSLHPKGAIARFLARRETERLSGTSWAIHDPSRPARGPVSNRPGRRAGLTNTHSRSLHAHLSCRIGDPKTAEIHHTGIIGHYAAAPERHLQENHPAPHHAMTSCHDSMP